MALSLAAAAFFALALAPSAGAAFPCGTALVRCQVQIDNRGRVWFESYEKLTEDSPGDGTLKHGVSEIYERDGNTTRLVSRLPDGQPILPEDEGGYPAFLNGVSPDGERVYLSTEATLSPEDADGGAGAGSADVYVLSGGAYTLLSTGPLDGGPNANPYAGSHTVWASDDGSYVYFETGQRLVPEDWDGASDIYQRHDGQTRLVSTGPAETLPTPEFPDPPSPQPWFIGASPDGATAYVATSEHLTADDTGRFTSDIYAWHDGVTTRLTRTVSPEEVPGTPWESFGPGTFAAADENGALYFLASSPQTPDDTDGNPDAYRARPDGSLERIALFPPGSDHGREFLSLQAVSHDGSRLFFLSSSQLTPEDRDEKPDAYMWSQGEFTLITAEARPSIAEEEALLCAIADNGHRAYFQTWGRLTPDDTDEKPDVYEWADGRVRLVSPAGEGKPGPSLCQGISPNGRFVAFSTWEELVPGDGDTKTDVYVVDMGADPAGSAAAARRQPGKRSRRRPRLVTAEAIAPRIGVGGVVIVGNRSARLRLRCPKAERSGPCHGRVKLLARGPRHRLLATGRFRVAAGHSRHVVLRGRGLRRHGARALVRARAADMLGNRRTVAAVVRLRTDSRARSRR